MQGSTAHRPFPWPGQPSPSSAKADRPGTTCLEGQRVVSRYPDAKNPPNSGRVFFFFCHERSNTCLRDCSPKLQLQRRRPLPLTAQAPAWRQTSAAFSASRAANKTNLVLLKISSRAALQRDSCESRRTGTCRLDRRVEGADVDLPFARPVLRLEARVQAPQRCGREGGPSPKGPALDLALHGNG